MSRGAPLRQKLLALLLGCVLALALAEGVLRIHDPFGFRVRGDRIVLPVHRKYTIRNTHFPQLDPVIRHTKNSLGFRGPEPPEDFDGALTVVMVGGSTTEDFYLADGRDWPSRVGAALAGRFAPFWLNNAGLNGHSSFGHLVLVEDFLARLRPDVIVFLTGVNDVGLAELREHDRLFLRRRGLDTRSWRGFVKSLAAYSRVADLAVNLHRYFAAVRLGVVERKPVDLRAPGPPTDPAALAALEREHRERYLPGYRRRLERLVARCRAAGIEPVLMTQPALYGPGADSATGADLGRARVDQLNGEMAWARLEWYNDVTREVAAEAGVALFDLARDLPRDSRLYYDWVHYTDEGAGAMAERVRSELEPWLAGRYPAHVRGGAPPADRP